MGVLENRRLRPVLLSNMVLQTATPLEPFSTLVTFVGLIIDVLLEMFPQILLLIKVPVAYGTCEFIHPGVLLKMSPVFRICLVRPCAPWVCTLVQFVCTVNS